ncbi:protein-disulfide reductase DsbD family protein [Brevundimonas sp.]|uniref:protein-disulfide reductase DsbD family protein n=1 Tax=Brevundimonas sp. TaxID=1871086 RepID=UPI002E152ABE|nr:thioredoxin family protein [Brevundimonas sp.]
MRRLSALILAFLLWPALAAAQPRTTERIEAELVSMSAWATPGSTLMLAVRQDIEPGWHTYWRNPGDSGGATTLDWRLPTGFAAGDIVWPLPERQRLGPLMNYGYSGVVYLPVPVQVPADAAPGSRRTFTVTALFLVCSAEMCVPDELELSLALPVSAGAATDTVHAGPIRQVLETSPRPAPIAARVTVGEDGRPLLTATGSEIEGVTRAYFFPFEGGVLDHAAAQTGTRGPDGLALTLTAGRGFDPAARPLAGVLDTDRGAFEVVAEPGDALPGTSGGGALTPEAEATAGAAVGVLAALGLALIGGLILNLMPCVFPILAMKAASLAATAHDAARARRDGLAFLAGVLVAFVALGGALLALRAAGQAVGWGFQLQSPGVMAGLTLLMLAVGLNLSGVYHVGAGLQAAAGSGPLSRLPGGVGAFFTGVLAVVVAAPCTAPFMALALGAALVMPWPVALLVFAMLGLGLALPYVAVSFSPAVLRRLPPPGPWMDRLKGVLAFPMYGTALWLAWVFSRQAGAEALALLFAASLLVAFGLWLAGLNQTARAESRPAVFSAAAAALALLAGLALAGTATMLPAPTSGAVPAGTTTLPSSPWSAEAVAAAQAEGRPVLVNFTADWCVTCKINERAALSSGRVAHALEAANAVYLVGDWTRRDDVIAAELARHGRSGVPLYLLYPAGGGEPRILPQLLTEGTIVRALQEISAR